MAAGNSPRILFDVTQLVHWSGKLTGIPRVMQELAVRFRRDNPDTVFVSWVKELEAFCEIDLDTTLAQRGQHITYRKKGTTSEVAASPQQTQALKSKALKAAKVTLRQTRRFSPELSERIEGHLKRRHLEAHKQLQFVPGDILIIPWGEWWDPNFISYLEEAVQQKVRLVQVIHDMGPIVEPQFSGHSTDSFPVYCRTILPLTNLVLSVSENTKRDIIAWLKDQKLAIPQIKVFREGDDFEVAKSIRPKDVVFVDSGLKGNDFVLCVGTIEAKKNHALLYYVYRLARDKGIQLPKLVIVGRQGWHTEAVFEMMTKDPIHRDSFVFMLNTSDEELSWLYDNCLFTVFPSFHEGWGIPIAESVARGVPCLCSNTSSMVEIAEGYVTHFSPASSDECLAEMQKLLDPATLQRARKKTSEYKQVSWNDSYQQVKKYVEGII